MVGCSLGGLASAHFRASIDLNAVLSVTDNLPRSTGYDVIPRWQRILLWKIHDFRFCLRGAGAGYTYVTWWVRRGRSRVLGFHHVCMLIGFVIFMQTRRDESARTSKEIHHNKHGSDKAFRLLALCSKPPPPPSQFSLQPTSIPFEVSCIL